MTTLFRKTLLVALLALAGTAWAQTAISLRFARTGTNAASTTVSVVDQDGEAVDGATATLASSHAFKATAGNVTSSILCPNVNATASPTIQLTFTLSGLPASFTYNSVGLDLHALNGGSTYQQNADGKQRQWNVAVGQGSSADAQSALATFADIDIAAGVGTTGSVHKVWQQTSATTSAATDPLVLTLTITKGATNSGCFLGLSELTLSTEEVEQPQTLPRPGDASRVYNIRWKANTTSYMTEDLGGRLYVTAYDTAERMFWELIPTEAEDVFYVRNTATGRYLGSCNQEPASTALVKTSATPIPYYIYKTAGTAAQILDCYWLSSTDCENYSDELASPRALNKDGGSDNVITWQAGTSRPGSYWTLEETDDLYEPRIREGHSAYARSMQIYQLPCSATGSNYLRSLSMGALSYSATAAPTESYTLYVASKGEATQGEEMQLALEYDAALLTGVEAWAYFDWDRDGEFETKYALPATQSGTLQVSVPKDARLGRTRMRLRITENALDGADEDAIGQAVDFILTVAAPTVPTDVATAQSVRQRIELTTDNRQISVVQPEGVRQLRLFATDGRQVAAAQGKHLPVGHLGAGTYLLQIQAAEASSTKVTLK